MISRGSIFGDRKNKARFDGPWWLWVMVKCLILDHFQLLNKFMPENLSRISFIYNMPVAPTLKIQHRHLKNMISPVKNLGWLKSKDQRRRKASNINVVNFLKAGEKNREDYFARSSEQPNPWPTYLNSGNYFETFIT